MPQIKIEPGRVLELKEGVVLNEDGSSARGAARPWLLNLKPGSITAGVLAAFAIPALLVFGLFFLGGFLSLAAVVLLFQPFARKSSGTDSHSSR
jgi:hypothetical protein